MPPDFTEEPAAFLPAVTDADTRAWALAVHRLWAQLCWQARAGHCAASSGHHATALLKGGHTATVLLEEVLMQDQSEHVQMQAMWDTRRRTTSAMPLGSGAAVHSMRTRQQASSINPSRPQLCMQTGQDWGTHRALPRHGPGHSTTSQVQCPAGGGERGVAPGAPQPAATAGVGRRARRALPRGVLLGLALGRARAARQRHARHCAGALRAEAPFSANTKQRGIQQCSW